MSWSDFTNQLVDAIVDTYNRAEKVMSPDPLSPDVAATAPDFKKHMQEVFKTSFIEKINNEYKDSDKIEDIKALAELVIDELIAGKKIDQQKVSALLDHREINNFNDAIWLIREAIIFKDYI